MNFELVIGSREIRCRLPLFGDRFRIITAFQNTFKDGDPDVDDFAAISYAAIGLVWDEPEPLDCKTFRQCDRDFVDYGEEVFDALFRLGFTEVGEIFRAGQAAREKIYASIPTQQEVDDAADPFGESEDISTATTSN